jgi:hypothetical protein
MDRHLAWHWSSAEPRCPAHRNQRSPATVSTRKQAAHLANPQRAARQLGRRRRGPGVAAAAPSRPLPPPLSPPVCLRPLLPAAGAPVETFPGSLPLPLPIGRTGARWAPQARPPGADGGPGGRCRSGGAVDEEQTRESGGDLHGDEDRAMCVCGWVCCVCVRVNLQQGLHRQAAPPASPVLCDKSEIHRQSRLSLTPLLIEPSALWQVCRAERGKTHPQQMLRRWHGALLAAAQHLPLIGHAAHARDPDVGWRRLHTQHRERGGAQ